MKRIKMKLILLSLICMPIGLHALVNTTPGTRVWDIMNQTQLTDVTVCSILDTISTLDITADFTELFTTIDEVQSKVSLLPPELMGVIPKAEQLNSGLDVINQEVNQLGQDFQSTWTILATITQQVCNSLALASAIENIEIQAESSVDFTDTFTLLDAIENKLCTVDSKVDITQNLVNNIDNQIVSDITGTFTALQSILDLQCSDADTLENYETTLGTPLSNGSSLTQITISSPGRYYLIEDLTYEPASSPKITISSSDVYLDLNNKLIVRFDSTASSTTAINIEDNASNVVITSGTLSNSAFNPPTTAISIGSNCTYCIFKNLFFQRLTVGFESTDLTNAIYKDNSFFRCAESLANIGGSNQQIIRNVNSIISGIPSSAFIPADSKQIFFYNFNAQKLIEGSNIVVENCASDLFDDTVTLSSTSTNCTIWHNDLRGDTQSMQASGGTSGKHEITSNNMVGHIDFSMTDCFIAFNNMKGSLIDLPQDATLGNYNFGAYVAGGSGDANAVSFSEGGSFPSPAPEYWNNLAASH
ncbi:MAG: hypothetical protein WD055_04065 [Candidatus Dependentiae bacterium]